MNKTDQLPRSLLWGISISFFYWFWIVFKPDEAYLVDLLVDVKGFTTEQVYQDIFPMWTYSYFVFIVVLAVLAEIISYKLCIILGSFGIFFGCALLVIPITYTEHSYYLYITYLDQWLEGLGSASGVIFSSYLFVLVPEVFFMKITSYSRSIQLMSSILSSFFGTFLVLVFSIQASFWATLVALSLATISSFFLVPTEPQCTSLLQFKSNVKYMVKILKNWEVAKWTLWSALYLGVHQLVLLNIQALWQNDGGSTDLNGIFYGLAYGCAAITTLIPSRFTPETLHVFGAFSFVVIPMLFGVLLVFLGINTSLFTSYILFIVYHSLFEFLYPVSSVIIALQLSEHLNYAFVFSFKTFLALLLQSIIQFIIGKNVLDLNIQQMFVALGILSFIVFVVVLFVMSVEFIYKSFCNNNVK